MKTVVAYCRSGYEPQGGASNVNSLDTMSLSRK
jgi:hypothetical protein